MKIGEKIKELRNARGLTLADVEARAGLSDGNLSRIERGKQWLTEEKLYAIAAALNVPVHELFLAHDSLNVAAAEQVSKIGGYADQLDAADRDWLSLKQYLGSDDISEFTAMIKKRQERNVKLIEELENSLNRGMVLKSPAQPIEYSGGTKKQTSQSS